MKDLRIFFVLLISILFLQCSKSSVSHEDEDSEQLIPDLTSVEKKLVESDNKFGLKLFKEIIKEEGDSNVFISPLSVAMALGMTYNGANGETQEAMQQALELNGLTLEEMNQSYKHLIELLTGLDPKVKFQIANSIWYRINDLVPREQFLSDCMKYYKSLVRGLDFNDPSSVDTINAWVKENTNGRITEIWEAPVDPLTVMFLIDAIYFKGAWTYQFDKTKTKDDRFYLPDGSWKPCKMMEQRGFFKYFENDTFQAIDLPYGDGDFSMSIFLPRWGINIDSLIAEFDQEKLKYWTTNLESDSIDVYLPRFRLEYERVLNDVLIRLGMGIAFAPAADFTKMYEQGGVWIDTVKHKSFLEVNEEGTEAAAVTIVVMEKGPPSGFRVNRPFVFMIRENVSGTILFIGKIVDPGFE
jgi:serpin B